MTIPMKGNWTYPTRVWTGPGRIAELPAACADLGIAKPLIVTDSGLRDSQMIKRAVASGWEVPLESGLALERELQQQLFASDDAREGIGAYGEKRKAAFSGK